MKYISGRDNLTEKHLEILAICESLEKLANTRKSLVLAELGGTAERKQLENPRYRRLQSRYFRAIERLQKLALFHGVSAIQLEILLIGTIGILAVSNWTRQTYIKFTQADKNELANSRSGVVKSLFNYLDMMPSAVYIRESRDAISHRLGFEITERDRVKEMADLALWVEIKSGQAMFFTEFEMVDDLSIFTEILAGKKKLRRMPASGDSVRVDAIVLKLYATFDQCFIDCKPKPIALFYIFQVQPIAD